MAEIAALTWVAPLPATAESIRLEARAGMSGYEPAASPQNVYLDYILPVGYTKDQQTEANILDGLFGVVFRLGCRVIVNATEHRVEKWPTPMVVISVYRASEVAHV